MKDPTMNDVMGVVKTKSYQDRVKKEIDISLMGLPKPVKKTKEQKREEKLAKPKRKAKSRKAITLPKLKKRVQSKVNEYVRLRDKGLPCISCGKIPRTPTAGHLWSQGEHGILRYELDNINSQCVACNLFKHGNLLEYKIGLIKKIGPDRVAYLDDHRHDLKKWTRQELLDIETHIKHLMEKLLA